MALDVINLVQGLKDCQCSARSYVHDFVEDRGVMPAGLDTKAWHVFTNPGLKEVYFTEIQHFVDRALYHLAIGKKLVAERNPTWGAVSFYYGGFFAAQAAIRLRGVMFFRVGYEQEPPPAETYRLEAVNLITDKYQMRKASGSGSEHVRVWSAFYDLYNRFSSRKGYADVAPVVELVETEERLADMHRRHIINYVPGYGYCELGSPRDLIRISKSLGMDVTTRFNDALKDPDGQLEARAMLRLKLCCGILKEIAAEGGTYHQFHASRSKARQKFLGDLKCPTPLAKALASWM